MREFFIALMMTAAAQTTAWASSSAWHEAEGARVRLLSTGSPDAEGRLAGALEIQLKPGWKTYWRDPGGSGVPPSVDVSANAGVSLLDMSFPAPNRFDDESGSWVGYKHSVTFPIMLRLTKASAQAPIAADVFIGVCQEICVPVPAKLSLDPASAPDDADDAATIAAATSALPGEPSADFGAEALSISATDALVAVSAGDDAGEAELYVASSDGVTVGTPQMETRDGRLVFSVPILDAPTELPGLVTLPYTLAKNGRAVGGVLTFRK